MLNIKRTNPIMKWNERDLMRNKPEWSVTFLSNVWLFCFFCSVVWFIHNQNEQQKISPKQIFLFWQPKKCDSGNSGSLSFSKSSIITVFCCACSICPIFLNREKKNSNKTTKTESHLNDLWMNEQNEMNWIEKPNQTKGDYGDYI